MRTHEPMKVINVVGARPNFMKMAPIIEVMNRHPREFNHGSCTPANIMTSE